MEKRICKRLVLRSLKRTNPNPGMKSIQMKRKYDVKMNSWNHAMYANLYFWKGSTQRERAFERVCLIDKTRCQCQCAHASLTATRTLPFESAMRKDLKWRETKQIFISDGNLLSPISRKFQTRFFDSFCDFSLEKSTVRHQISHSVAINEEKNSSERQ